MLRYHLSDAENVDGRPDNSPPGEFLVEVGDHLELETHPILRLRLLKVREREHINKNLVQALECDDMPADVPVPINNPFVAN